jgi:hypothetical protein
MIIGVNIKDAEESAIKGLKFDHTLNIDWNTNSFKAWPLSIRTGDICYMIA